MKTGTRVLKNQYYDSVALMLASRTLREREGVADAALIMGTDVNKDLLRASGLLTRDGEAAGANDLIITVQCEREPEALLDEAEGLLQARAEEKSRSDSTLKTVRSAIISKPDLNLAVISVAGAYAAREAREALAGGMHVLLFSDNVTLADEIALKKMALERRLLLMGPGAGTAIINGVGLGFANAVPRGKIGIVSAAGTGLQEVSTLIARHGGGISQGIGTGGRDLSAAVGGLTFFAAVDALMADKQTETVVLISKPPDEVVSQKLIKKLYGSRKEIVLCLLGADLPEKSSKNLIFTRTLEECALTAVGKAKSGADQFGAVLDEWEVAFDRKQRYVRGLFSGGTLCYEAQIIWADFLKEPVLSNAPVDKKMKMPDSTRSSGHTAVDLGEEEFTVGRPHPMIDNDMRVRRMRQEAADRETAVILLDVVIGYGAHEDPAGELGAAILDINHHLKGEERRIAFIASVTGTEADPQGYAASVDKLKKAGVIVCDSNAQAARLAALMVSELT